MVTIHFESVAPELANRVSAGATLDEAARALRVNTNTARAWLRKGRAGEARYATFAAQVDDAKAAQVAPKESAAMTRDEWEGLLAEAIRSGSIPAMKLWADTHPITDEPPADPFSEFDALAEQRKQRG